MGVGSCPAWRASSSFKGVAVIRQTSSFGAGTPRAGLSAPIRALFRTGCSCSKIGGADPEHFALRILGFKPEKFGLRISRLQSRPAAADLAQQPAIRGQMPLGPAQNAADDFEPIGAAVEGQLRLGAALARQAGHAFRIDI